MDNGLWLSLAFYLLAATVLGSAFLVVLLRNIVHSVLWLAVCFVSLAGLYLTLDADFLAAIQVLIYAGAVCIMVVFGIMLIQRADMKQTNLFNKQTRAAAGVVALVLAVTGYLSAVTQWGSAKTPVPKETVGSLAELMLTKYVIPFEVAAILLLVALVGAIIIAKEVKG